MDDALKSKLQGFGMNEAQVAQLEEKSGASTCEDLAMLSDVEIVIYSGCTPIAAKKVVAAFAPAPVAPTVEVVDPAAELPEGAKPSAAAVSSFASQIGMDPSMLTMMMLGGNMAGMGESMDMSGMIPVRTIVDGYNPKVRNMFYMVIGQLEKRLGAAVVVINADGSVNKDLTVEYIEGLEEGRDFAEGNVYDDASGNPFEIIAVGVDAQSIYDADPLDSSKALQKNGMGIGRVNWNGVSLEVRQVAFFAAKTGELNGANEAHLTWLRDHVVKGANRLVFRGQAPKALAQFNEAARTGSLPTLRVMLSRSPRRKEMMPRRRPAGIGFDTPVSGRHPVDTDR